MVVQCASGLSEKEIVACTFGCGFSHTRRALKSRFVCVLTVRAIGGPRLLLLLLLLLCDVVLSFSLGVDKRYTTPKCINAR